MDLPARERLKLLKIAEYWFGVHAANMSEDAQLIGILEQITAYFERMPYEDDK
jgi:hypothetical protein